MKRFSIYDDRTEHCETCGHETNQQPIIQREGNGLVLIEYKCDECKKGISI